MLKLQGLLVSIHSIRPSFKTNGEQGKGYWGEVVGENRQRKPYKMGADQVKELMTQAGVDTLEKLQGTMFTFDGKEGDMKHGAFMSTAYTDKEGVEQKRTNTTLIVASRVHYVSQYNPICHKLCDFSELLHVAEEPSQEEGTDSTTTVSASTKATKTVKAVAGDMVAA